MTEMGREMLWPVESDTDRDVMPLFLDSRRIPAAPEADELGQSGAWTTTEPVPAPIFEQAMRRIERAIIIGAAIMGASIVCAAWCLG